MNTQTKQSNIIGLKDLRLNIEKYIKLIQKGHSFTVIRKSNPVFKLEPIDKWGDEGTWDIIADFSSLQPENGIPMSDLLIKLKTF
jgi:antitoxin (DNA-binding transcriptional repressor) of toxin-antitoxin stability system